MKNNAVKCKDCEAGALCIFTEKARQVLENKLVPVYFKGEVIIRAGQPYHGIFCVKSGKLKVMSQSPEGDVLVGFAGPGDVVGCCQIEKDGIGHLNITALEETRGCFIAMDNFKKILQQCDNEFSMRLLSQLLKKKRNTEILIGYMSSKKSVVRFCGLLKEIIHQFGLNSKNELELSLTIKEWAELANLQRETLQRLKKKLELAQILKWSKKTIEVKSIHKLEEIILKEKLNGKK